MNRLVKILFVVFLILAGFVLVSLTRAQTGAIQYFAPPTGTTVTNCGTPTSGFPMCGVATGWFIWSGTAWVQIGTPPVAAGVTSWNGQTGAVTYTPPAAPVTSVNGKTGAVVLSAVTTTTSTAPTSTSSTTIQ